jgi:hypothetical protein
LFEPAGCDRWSLSGERQDFIGKIPDARTLLDFLQARNIAVFG